MPVAVVKVWCRGGWVRAVAVVRFRYPRGMDPADFFEFHVEPTLPGRVVRVQWIRPHSMRRRVYN